MKNEINLSMAGRFKIEAYSVDSSGVEIPGSRRVAADWFSNLITNNGLDIAFTTSYLQFCQVGSGSAAPAVTDSALSSLIASTQTVQSESMGSAAAAPDYGWKRRTYRFAAGVAAGNLSEVGVGGSSSGNLFSRALILDGSGNPTTITVLADEVLDVTYELRLYSPTTDITGNVTISGTSYAFTARAARVREGSSSIWSYQLGSAIVVNTANVAGGAYLYNGAVGAITSIPGGSREGVGFSNGTYTNGNYYRDITVSASLNEANLSGGVTAAHFDTSAGAYQIGFSPALAKDSTKTLSLTFRLSIARHAP